jgi:hypothetical protein
MLTDGADSARAYWFDEPGEYRWIFKRRGSTVRARILHYEDEGPPLRFLEAVTGRWLIDRVCSFRELVSAVAAGARQVLDEYGVEEYRHRWVRHPFPEDHLAALERALK